MDAARRLPGKAHRVQRAFFALLLMGAICLATNAFAHLPEPGDEDDDDSPSAPTAYLSLSYDARATLQATIYTDVDVADWSRLRPALEQALHCPAGSLHQPNGAPDGRLSTSLKNDKSFARMQAFYEQQQKRNLSGSCQSAMTHQGLMLYAGVRLSAVVAELHQIGEQQLEVNVTYSPTTYARLSRSRKQRGLDNEFYQFDTNDPSSASLHLQFGLTRAEALHSAILPLVVLMAPLMLVMWMQRSAIRRAESDPVAAWFSYFRGLNWCMTGIILVWILGNSARSGMEDLFPYELGSQSTTAVALRVAILLLPPWTISLICLLSSYRVYVTVRGNKWTRGEFYSNQFVQIASQLLPLTCLFCALEMIQVNSRFAVGFGVAYFFALKFMAIWKLRVTKTHPEALTTGELRDRVFDLAHKATVELRQVFIMPAGKSLMANAFAGRNGIVIFTDYLLNRLNKREVSAVAAHEITHLQKKHVMWRSVALIGLILSPMILRTVASLGLGALMSTLAMHSRPGLVSKLYGGWFKLQAVPELDLIFFLIALCIFYVITRHQENSADAGAVHLTGDPEAVITGLLKLGRLNLLPVEWGRVSGSLLTHPSTLKRVQRVARLGQVPGERLQQLLLEQEASGRESDAESLSPQEKFSEAETDTRRVVTTGAAMQSALLKLWALWALHIVPPAAVAWCVYHWRLQNEALIYVAGAVATVVLYFIVARGMAVWGRATLKNKLRAKLDRELIAVDGRDVQLVGFAPGAELRFYVSSFNWDRGHMFLTRERLCFIGDQTSFTLKPEQVREVRLGPGTPSWLPTPRVYVDWWDDEASVIRTWNISSIEPCSLLGLRKQAEALCEMLHQWRNQPSAYEAASAELMALAAPHTREVTGHSLAFVYSFGRMLKGSLLILIAGWTLGLVLRLPGVWYICAVILLLRLYEAIPFWFYKGPRGSKRVMESTPIAG